MNPPHAVFATTRWTLVARAQGETPDARAALSDLCEAYWQPVFRFLLREGRGEDDARELTQDFFARLLRQPSIDSASPTSGRFRSYLLGALRHFLADRSDHARRLKRGGGVVPTSLDTEPSEGGAAVTPTVPPADDTWFDREWAFAVMEHALARLQEEFADERKAAQFALLKGWLAGDATPIPQAEAAEKLGLTEGAVKVAIHRLRRRFRDLLHAELADTLPDHADPAEELRYLVTVLGRTPHWTPGKTSGQD